MEKIIEIGDTVKISTLIALRAETSGRFVYNIHSSGLFAEVSYVNYILTAKGYKSMIGDTARLTDRITKTVMIGGE